MCHLLKFLDQNFSAEGQDPSEQWFAVLAAVGLPGELEKKITHIKDSDFGLE